jgi:hypothetical protein
LAIRADVIDEQVVQLLVGELRGLDLELVGR